MEDFFLWLQPQPRKYELIDGQPVVVAGTNQDHKKGTRLLKKPVFGYANFLYRTDGEMCNLKQVDDVCFTQRNTKRR